MGSVPIHMPKLFGVSALVEVLGWLVTLLVDFEYEWLFLLSGFIYFFVIYMRYRNSNARHHHEIETRKKMFNLRKVDNLIKRQKGLSNSQINGANNTKVSGQSISEAVFDSLNPLK